MEEDNTVYKTSLIERQHAIMEQIGELEMELEKIKKELETLEKADGKSSIRKKIKKKSVSGRKIILKRRRKKSVSKKYTNDGMKRKTDVNSQDSLGKTALMYAADNYPETIKLLSESESELDVNIRDNLGKTALMYAAARNYAVTRELIGAGANVNIQDNLGNTALIYGAEYFNIVRELIEAGANVNFQDNSGKTALMYATFYMCIDVYSLAIGNEREGGSINVNIQDNLGKTALMYISHNAYDIALRSLLHLGNLIRDAGGEGLNVNIQDSNGKTALMYAAASVINNDTVSRIEAVNKIRMLLSIDGIELELQDIEGNTVFEYLERNGIIHEFPGIQERFNYLKNAEIAYHARNLAEQQSLIRTEGAPLSDFPTKVFDSEHVLSSAIKYLNPSPGDGNRKEVYIKKSKKRSPKKKRKDFF